MSAQSASPSKAFQSTVAHWLNRRRSGQMSAVEMRAFQVWLEKDSRNKVAYEDLERFWEGLGDVAEDPAIIQSYERDMRRFDRRAQMKALGGWMSGAALLSVCVWAITSSGILSELGWIEGARQELRTSVGQRTTVTLRDNSVVTLDTDTVLRIRESFRERRVELERGRAFFQVAKDKSRPFIVAAAGRTVQATGTAFDVRVDPGRMQVTLVEGRVRVRDVEKTSKLQQSAEMRPGWRLNAIENEPWRVAPIDLRKETSWHEGKLSFLNDPLVEAVAEVNRYSNRKITFEGPPPEVAVIGVFQAGDLDEFVTGIKLNRLARVVRSDKAGVVLAAR